jgi:hypothetical protein
VSSITYSKAFKISGQLCTPAHCQCCASVSHIHASTDPLVVVPHALRRMFLKQVVQRWELCRQLHPSQNLAFTSVQMAARSGHHSAQGTRRTMEDAVVQHEIIAVPEVDISGAAVYCVFDGHGGPTCADYARDYFVEKLVNQLRAGHDWRRALCECYAEIDAALVNAPGGAVAVSVVFDGMNK